MSPSDKVGLSLLTRAFVHLRMPLRDCSYSRHYYAGSLRHSVIVVIYPSDFILSSDALSEDSSSDYMHQWRSTSSGGTLSALLRSIKCHLLMSLWDKCRIPLTMTVSDLGSQLAIRITPGASCISITSTDFSLSRCLISRPFCMVGGCGEKQKLCVCEKLNQARRFDWSSDERLAVSQHTAPLGPCIRFVVSDKNIFEFVT